MLLQVQEGKMMSLREGMRVMAAEGAHGLPLQRHTGSMLRRNWALVCLLCGLGHQGDCSSHWQFMAAAAEICSA
jgi:hypothetical protein